MGSFSAWHWLIVAIVVLLLFGRGRISETMGDFGKGLRSFKKGMADEDAPADAPPPPRQVSDRSAPVAAQPVTPAQTTPAEVRDQDKA